MPGTEGLSHLLLNYTMASLISSTPPLPLNHYSWRLLQTLLPMSDMFIHTITCYSIDSASITPVSMHKNIVHTS